MNDHLVRRDVSIFSLNIDIICTVALLYISMLMY